MAMMRLCVQCGEAILVPKHLMGRKRYCSKGCAWKAKIGKRPSKKTEFKIGNRPQTWVPVGSEIIAKGYVRVKVKEPNIWCQKSHVIWEETNGKQLPAGWIVRHDDGDPLNDDSRNLSAMPRSRHILKTLENPDIERRTRQNCAEATRQRHRNNRLKRYDSYYWQSRLG
jgi:hypothetical protein